MDMFCAVPFGQRPKPPLTLFQKEVSGRPSSDRDMASPLRDAHAKESLSVTVLGPRKVREIDSGGAEDRAAKGGAAAGAGAGAAAAAAGVETTNGRPGEVLVRFTIVQEEQPEGEKQLCRALGLVRQPPSSMKVAGVKPGSCVAKWGVEPGSDIVEVRSDCVIIAVKVCPMAQERMSAVQAGKEEVPVLVPLEVETVSEAMETLAAEEKSGSSMLSITERVNASAGPNRNFTPQEVLKAVQKGMGSGKIRKENGFYKLHPGAPAFPTVIEGRGGMISVGSKKPSGGRVQEMLWCLHLSSDGARAAKHKADLKLPPSHERARAWLGLEDDQRKALGFQAKEVLLRDSTRYIEVEEVADGSEADRHGVRPGDVVESVGERSVMGFSKTRFVLTLADALLEPEDQSDVCLRVVLLRKKLDTGSAMATTTATAPARAAPARAPAVAPRARAAATASTGKEKANSGSGKGKSKKKNKQKEKDGSRDEAFGGGWVSATAVAASKREDAERARKRESRQVGGGPGGSSSSSSWSPPSPSSSSPAAAAPVRGEGEPKGKGEGEEEEEEKEKEAQRALGGATASEGGRVSPRPEETSTCASGNLPFRPPPPEAEVRPDKGDATSNGASCKEVDLRESRLRWGMPTPLDAVQPIDPSKFRQQSHARSIRKNHRGGRPGWWGDRVPGSTLTTLKLRLASQLPGEEPQGVEESKGEEAAAAAAAVPRQNSRDGAARSGAFLLEDLTIGTSKNRVIIPAGAQLISVDGKDCGNLPFEEVRRAAMEATGGSSLVFDDVPR